jgi:hypothetical protein
MISLISMVAILRLAIGSPPSSRRVRRLPGASSVRVVHFRRELVVHLGRTTLVHLGRKPMVQYQA